MSKNIIIVTGIKQSGKDTFADECIGYNKIGLADELKLQSEVVIELIFKDLKGRIVYDWESNAFKESIIPSIYNKINKRTGKKMTFRAFLEDYGTGLIRNCINDEYHSMVTRQKIVDSEEENHVVKDCRFIDEYLAFKDYRAWNAALVHVERGYKCVNPMTESEICKLAGMADFRIDSKCGLAEYRERCKNVFYDIQEMFNN